AAALEAAGRQVGGQAQLGQAEVGAVRVLVDEERVVPLAQEGGVLARRHRAVADDVRVGHEGRDAGTGGGESVHDGAVGGEQVARVAQALVVGGRGVAGQAVVAGRVVVVHL